MKKIIIPIFMLVLCSFTPAHHLEDTAKGNIVITFENLAENKGVVEVSLYGNKKKFLKKNGALMTKRVPVEDNTVKVIFPDVPHGSYAVTSFHDINNNDKVDRNLLGIPKEPVAVSKLKKKILRKPKFKEAKLDFNQAELVLKMEFVEY